MLDYVLLHRQTLRLNLYFVVRVAQSTMFLGVTILYLLFLRGRGFYETLI